jgi:Cu(I)/Ag(I) efflux system membrane fusion protein/cobalt-zinc-cadmium efflux system membrane fusion protein
MKDQLEVANKRSAMPEGRTRSERRRGFVRYGGTLMVLVAGILAGLLFREPILHLLGAHQQSPVDGVESTAKHQLWTCGMHPQVIQDEPGLCPICHMKLTPLSIGDESGGEKSGADDGERKVKYWWDPMLGAASISDQPGTSAMGMALVPVYEGRGSGDGTAVTIDPVVVQNMGVRVADAKIGPMSRTLRTVGYLEEAQPLVHDVNLRVSGWIEKLHAATVGVHLTAGEKLFDLYSPEVQVALEELIAARSAADTLGSDTDALAQITAVTILDAARRKLEQWGLSKWQVEQLAKLNKAPRTVTFTSPITGHVTEKMVVEGSAVNAGDIVMRIVDHSTLWLDSQVYAQDQPFIELGQKVIATIEGVPGRQFEGEIIFIHPHIDPTTRTVTVRIAIANPEMALRPGMYATADIDARLAETALLVPREAVIDTGIRQLVFVAKGEGRFEPRNVKTGVSSSDGTIQILDGIVAGERVVTSGQFLLDAESRLREAIQKHLADRLLTASDQPDSVASCADVDSMFVPYLAMTTALGGEQPPRGPLDTTNLVVAAKAILETTPNDHQARVRAVVTAALALDGKSLEQQRELFAPLSEAMVAVAEVCPPSSAIANVLFVMSCPMKNARWLQTTDTVANPYYATEMKQCGEVQRTLVAGVPK